jgi:hypothetical protein
VFVAQCTCALAATDVDPNRSPTRAPPPRVLRASKRSRETFCQSRESVMPTGTLVSHGRFVCESCGQAWGNLELGTWNQTTSYRRGVHIQTDKQTNEQSNNCLPSRLIRSLLICSWLTRVQMGDYELALLVYCQQLSTFQPFTSRTMYCDMVRASNLVRNDFANADAIAENRTEPSRKTPHPTS